MAGGNCAVPRANPQPFSDGWKTVSKEVNVSWTWTSWSLCWAENQYFQNRPNLSQWCFQFLEKNKTKCPIAHCNYQMYLFAFSYYKLEVLIGLGPGACQWLRVRREFKEMTWRNGKLLYRNESKHNEQWQGKSTERELINGAGSSGNLQCQIFNSVIHCIVTLKSTVKWLQIYSSCPVSLLRQIKSSAPMSQLKQRTCTYTVMYTAK